MQNDQQNGQFYYPGQQQQPESSDSQQPAQPTPPQDNVPNQNPQQPPVEVEQYSDENSIHWTASEFVQHDKNANWYFLLALATVIVAATAYFVLGKDLFAPSVVLILGVIFGIAGSRKPRILEYSVSDYGLTVGQRHFNFEDFKSFSLIGDGPISTILLMPAKRFSPTLTIYVPDEETDGVLDALSIFLPIEQHEIGYVDKLMSKIRF